MKKGIYKASVCYKDLKDTINSVAKDFAEDTAFKYKRDGKKVEVSYSRFKKDIDGLGTYFMSKGYVQKRIAVYGENSYNWVVTYFSVVNSNGVIVPIDKELKASEVVALLEASETSLMVYADNKQKVVDEMIELGAKCEFMKMSEVENCIAEGNKLISSGNNDFINAEIDAEKMCAIIFTSGTTGIPKGVMLSHKNLVRDAFLSISVMKIPRDTVIVLPMNHTFGFMACVLCQIWMGYSIYINNNLKNVISDLQEAKPGHISVVPLFVESIYKNIWRTAEKTGKAGMLRKLIKTSNALRKVGIDARRTLFKSVLDKLGGNIEMIISGGAPIDDLYMKGFDDLGITIINGFGITECSPIVALNRVEDIKYGTVGEPIPTVEVEIRNKDENDEGEIWVKGDIVMMGYYNNPEATDAVMKDGWFNTEDIGKIIDGKYLAITGRKKNLIILANGKNVSPEEIETEVCRIENVTEALVYEEDELITVEIFSDVEGDKEAIRNKIKEDIQALNQRLADYKRIKRVKFRSVEFEKTTTKKIKRNYNK